jgi:hypothetical protein
MEFKKNTLGKLLEQSEIISFIGDRMDDFFAHKPNRPVRLGCRKLFYNNMAMKLQKFIILSASIKNQST